MQIIKRVIYSLFMLVMALSAVGCSVFFFLAIFTFSTAFLSASGFCLASCVLAFIAAALISHKMDFYEE